MSEDYLLFLNVAYSFSILRPLQAAIRRRGGVAAWFLHGLNPSLLKPDELLLHSVDEVKRFNPRAVFVPGTWVPDFFPGIKVQVFHGLGIWKKGHFRIRGLFDLYCTHGPATTLPFQELAERYRYFRVVQTGWPKVDALFRSASATDREKTSAVNKPVILYAPTFSPAFTSAPALAETIRSMAAQGRYHWLIKVHPLMDQGIVDMYRRMECRDLTFVEDPDILPCLRAADVMLTDESSVVAEFLLLGKPVVTFRNSSPGPYLLNVLHTSELEGAIGAALNDAGDMKRHADEFIRMNHPYDDGMSSERVLDAADRFIDQYKGRLKAKPPNVWRKIKIRRRMRYYRLR